MMKKVFLLAALAAPALGLNIKRQITLPSSLDDLLGTETLITETILPTDLGDLLPTNTLPVDLPTVTNIGDLLPTELPTGILSNIVTDIPTGIVGSIPTAVPTNILDNIGNLTACVEPAMLYVNATQQCSINLNAIAMNLTDKDVDSPSDAQIKAWVNANTECYCTGDALANGQEMYDCYESVNITNPYANYTNLNNTDNSTGELVPALYLINGTDAQYDINRTYAGICAKPALSFATFSSGWAQGVFTNETYIAVRKYMMANGMLKESNGESNSATSNIVSFSSVVVASVAAFLALML